MSLLATIVVAVSGFLLSFGTITLSSIGYTLLSAGVAELPLYLVPIKTIALLFALRLLHTDWGRSISKPTVLFGISLSIALILFVAGGTHPFQGSNHPGVELVVLAIASGAGFSALRWMFNDLRLAGFERYHIEILVLRFLRIIGFTFIISAVLLPLGFAISASLMTRVVSSQDPTNLLPLWSFVDADFWTGLGRLFSGYAAVFTRYSFVTFLVNSLGVATSTVLGTLVAGTPAAYAVARLFFRGRDVMQSSIIVIYLFPAIVIAIPLYTIFSMLGLRNTHLGLVIVYMAQTIPVAIYMLKNYFVTIPWSLEEAAMIDGCTRGGVIWRVTLPLSIPALISVGLYVFMIAWSEFMFALMFLDSPDLFTVSRGMALLDDQDVPRQFLMAGSVIVTIPVLSLFFLLDRFFQSGLTVGGEKG